MKIEGFIIIIIINFIIIPNFISFHVDLDIWKHVNTIFLNYDINWTNWYFRRRGENLG